MSIILSQPFYALLKKKKKFITVASLSCLSNEINISLILFKWNSFCYGFTVKTSSTFTFLEI